MKFLGLFILLSSTQVLAAPVATVQDCFKIKNGLDRKYCMDKYLEGYRNSMTTEKKGWAKGLDKKSKADKEAILAQEIQAKKDHLAIIQQEISYEEKHLADLKAVKVIKEEKKKEKKKKKNDLFGIKL